MDRATTRHRCGGRRPGHELCLAVRLQDRAIEGELVGEQFGGAINVAAREALEVGTEDVGVGHGHPQLNPITIAYSHYKRNHVARPARNGAARQLTPLPGLSRTGLPSSTAGKARPNRGRGRAQRTFATEGHGRTRDPERAGSRPARGPKYRPGMTEQARRASPTTGPPSAPNE